MGRTQSKQPSQGSRKDLGGRARGGGPGDPSPSYPLERWPPERPRSEMPTLTIPGINRSMLVSRPREGASLHHDAARAMMARSFGTSRSNPMTN
jgi:hypothetical protein